MLFSFTLPFTKRQETPFLEPTNELVASLFERVDIKISFGKDYEGIPQVFSVSALEKKTLQTASYINIEYHGFYEGGLQISYGLEAGKEESEPAVQEALRNICKRLKIYPGKVLFTGEAVSAKA